MRSTVAAGRLQSTLNNTPVLEIVNSSLMQRTTFTGNKKQDWAFCLDIQVLHGILWFLEQPTFSPWLTVRDKEPTICSSEWFRRVFVCTLRPKNVENMMNHLSIIRELSWSVGWQFHHMFAISVKDLVRFIYLDLFIPTWISETKNSSCILHYKIHTHSIY